MRLVTAKMVHPPYPHKTTARDASSTGRGRRPPAGSGRCVLLTEGGIVAECGIWSLFWWDGGRVAAPPLELGVLPGVARTRIEELRGRVEEQTVDPERSFRGGRSSSPMPCGAWSRWYRWTGRRCRNRGNRRAGRTFLALTRAKAARTFCCSTGDRQLPAVAVAQLVRAPDCGSGGCGFNSRQPPSDEAWRRSAARFRGP